MDGLPFRVESPPFRLERRLRHEFGHLHAGQSRCRRPASLPVGPTRLRGGRASVLVRPASILVRRASVLVRPPSLAVVRQASWVVRQASWFVRQAARCVRQPSRSTRQASRHVPQASHDAVHARVVVRVGSRDAKRAPARAHGVGAGQGVVGADANGQHACTTVFFVTVTVVAMLLSCAAVVSPAVPNQ